MGKIVSRSYAIIAGVMAKTSEIPNASLTSANLAFCEFARLPKPGQRLSGLSRTCLNELCLSGKIRSALLRKEGARRGIRLIYLPSLTEFILRHCKGGEEDTHA